MSHVPRGPRCRTASAPASRGVGGSCPRSAPAHPGGAGAHVPSKVGGPGGPGAGRPRRDGAPGGSAPGGGGLSGGGAARLGRRRLLAASGVLGAAWVLGACASDDPLGTRRERQGEGVIVGSQQYYSNEVIAELYAQAMEAVGLTISRQYQIGQREVYVPELRAGNIDVIPEYGGNLLSFLDKEATARDAEGIQAALLEALPANLTVLEPAQATDQDSYVVTRATAERYQLTSIADLRALGRAVTIAANSELATRPYGPTGLESVYGVRAVVEPVEDSGGPLTLKALTDGDVDVADIYTASPAATGSDLVVLTDPQGLIVPQRVTPLVSATLAPEAREAIGAVNARLSAQELPRLNRASAVDHLPSADIASQWLASQGIV